jgi:hypothetical protein
MNRSKNTNLSLSLREMAASGIPLDLSVVELGVALEQAGGVNDNIIFDLPDGRAGCLIWLRIINQASKPIPCRGVRLRPPWTNWEFEWLSDPRDVGGDPFNYHFPGKGAPEMPRDQVLNHVLFGRGILKHGYPMEGCLLGIGSPKPSNLVPGGSLEFTLTIVGQDHNEYAETVTLWVDPIWKRQQKSRKITRQGLFENERQQNFRVPILANSAHRANSRRS